MPRRAAGRPSLATVADRLGVSTATVSNAFNRPALVSETLRDQVFAEAARQGYAGPDPAARQLSRGRTDTLGLLFTGELSFAFGDPGAVGFLEGLTQSCQTAELNLLLIASDVQHHRPAAVGNAVVDGFVVYSVSPHDPHLRQILDRRLPTVVVDSPRDLAGVDWVGSDDRAGGRSIGRYLTGLGHRRIGAVGAGPGDSPLVGTADDSWATGPTGVHRERLFGLRDALGEVGVDDLPVELRPENSIAAGRVAAAALLDRRPDLTAVVALTDLTAIGALDVARTRDIDVPARLTVTGYDDIPRSAAIGLTTVSQPLVDKGRIAGELYLSHRPGSPDRRRLLPTHVEVRATSAPPAR